jgi:hypothetical protein
MRPWFGGGLLAVLGSVSLGCGPDYGAGSGGGGGTAGWLTPGECDGLDCASCCAERHPGREGDSLVECACQGPCATDCASVCEGGLPTPGCVACVTFSGETCRVEGDGFDECMAACGSGGEGGSSSSAAGVGAGTGAGAGGSGSTGAGASSGAGAGTGSGDASEACVTQINAYRAQLGLPAYERWTTAEACTDGQTQSDSQTGQAHGAFGQCDEWAQNECPGWPGPPGDMILDCLAAMWSEGPGGGHYENMRSSSYERVACGFYTTPSGDVWAIQNFQ